MNNLLVLVRREYWENRSLWIAPLVIAGLILFAAVTGGIHAGDDGSFIFNPDEGPSDVELAQIAGGLDKQRAGYGVFLAALTGFQLLVLGIVVFFYLLDSLLGERKDRSILFWKSLPISDTQVVASKTLTALVATPLYVLLVSAVTQLVFGVIWAVRSSGNPVLEMLIPFDAGVWLQVQAGSFLLAFATIVWYLPLAGYLLLVSVWARKNAFLWAVLPPVALMIGEAILMRTHHLADFLGRRFSGVYEIMAVNQSQAMEANSALGLFAQRVGVALVHWETWAGIAVAVVLFAAVVRIRRYRDDS